MTRVGVFLRTWSLDKFPRFINVLRGVFFSGVPFTILEAWKERRLQLVVSLEILDE